MTIQAEGERDNIRQLAEQVRAADRTLYVVLQQSKHSPLWAAVVELRTPLTRLLAEIEDAHEAQPVTRLVAEARDALAAERAAAALFVETWSELLVSLPDDYTCTMNCGEAEAAAQLLRAFGRADTADALIEAHADHDEPGDEHCRTLGELNGL